MIAAQEFSGQEKVIDLSARYDPRRNEKQMEFHSATETYKLYGGAMGGGKTAALINEGQMLSLDYPGNFGLFLRKTWPSFRDTVLPQIEKFTPAELISDWNRSDKIITLVNRSRIRYGGLGDDPTDWQKFMSGEYGWVALEQVEEFTEQEFRMLSTRLRLRLPGIRYFFLLSCNPHVGWIKRLFLEGGLKDSVFIPALPQDNVENLPSDYIGRMRDVLDANQQKALLEGDWEAIGDPDNVYNYLKVRTAMKRRVEPSEPYEIGVDVARSGADETVITLREGLRVRIVGIYQGADTMWTAKEAWRFFQERILLSWKRDSAQLSREEKESRILRVKLKVDADGLGAGVVDRLREIARENREWLSNERISIEVLEIHGAGIARDKVHFKNLRAEVHWALRELLDEVDLPDDDELSSQLMAIKYRIDSAGRIEIVPKEDIKEKLGRSPDRAESVIYALADVRPTAIPRIRSLA